MTFCNLKGKDNLVGRGFVLNFEYQQTTNANKF